MVNETRILAFGRLFIQKTRRYGSQNRNDRYTGDTFEGQYRRGHLFWLCNGFDRFFTGRMYFSLKS